VVAVVVVVGMRLLGLFQGLELQAFDTLMRSRPAEEPDPRLLVVTVTETDLQQHGAPLPDGVLAEAITQLQTHQPRLIGLDIFRDQPREPGHAQLRQQLRQENAIALCSIREADNPNRPGIAPPPEVNVSHQGFSDVVVDHDHILRRHLVFMQPSPEDSCQTEYALSTRLALRYLHLAQFDMKTVTRDRIQVGPIYLDRLSPNAGAYHNLDNRGFQLMLNYRAGTVAPTVGLGELLAGTVDPDLIQDRIVLLGITAPLSNSADYFLTPYSAQTQPYNAMPGVMIHAHMTSQLLAAALDGRSLIWMLPTVAEMIWIALWAALGGWVVGRSQRLAIAGAALGVAELLLAGICWLVLLHGGWLPWVPAGIALSLGAGGNIGYRRLRG
jgi:CHASE2 domain-containing sensor protein